jgi:hypothetical protein
MLGLLLVLGRRHFEAVLSRYVDHYNMHRPYRSLTQRAPSSSDATLLHDVDLAQLRRPDRVSGLIHKYRMVA